MQDSPLSISPHKGKLLLPHRARVRRCDPGSKFNPNITFRLVISDLDFAAFIETASHITSEVPPGKILRVLLESIAGEFTDAFTRYGGVVFHRYTLNNKIAGATHPGQHTLALALEGRSIMGATAYTLVLLLGRGWNTNGVAYLLQNPWCHTNILLPHSGERIALELAPDNPPLRLSAQRDCSKFN